MTVTMNEAQKHAVEHQTGPCLVLAGPGSGKTTVITNRINFLIKHGVNPSNILVITFTKAAANEMKERFQRINGKNQLVSFGTFHAVFFQILKYAYHYKAENIVREDDRRFFFKECIRKLQLEIEDETDFIQGIISEISRVKNDRLSLEHYYSTNCSEDVFRKIFREYANFLNRKNQIDFDDMLVYCYELLSNRKDILGAWQKKYQYILIDEFQDINRIQYDIIKLLALPENNLFIVGDDDQSIYRFRGAKPKIMMNFEKDYPDSDKVLLNVNYRCSQDIVNAALQLIQYNTERFPKKLQASRKEGPPLVIREFPVFMEENLEIVKKIQEYRKMGFALKEMAVLYRTNTQPRVLVQKLMEYNLPFRMKDSMPNIYEHWIVKNLLAYIHIALGSKRRTDFFQIMNKPKRYLSRDAFLSEQVNLFDVKEFYMDKDWMLERIERLEYDFRMLKDMNPFSAIQYIRKGIAYDEFLDEYALYRKMNSDELYEILDEVQETAKEYKSYEQWFSHMEDYSRELREQAKKRGQLLEAVTLSTMHGAKGLEYSIVFIMDANEGITPHHRAALDEDIEEERRMFYVAMTRAKDYLHIYASKERYNKELVTSRFVREIIQQKPSNASPKHPK